MSDKFSDFDDDRVADAGSPPPAIDGAPARRARRFMHIDDGTLRLLVDEFYTKARRDPQIGPIFDRVIGDNWDEHLAKMADFWSSVMLTSGRYKGNPVLAHLRLKEVTPDHFERWLSLFGETCGELYEDAPAEALRAKAARIAESLKIAMFYRLDPLRVRAP
jgi:hemoglobin